MKKNIFKYISISLIFLITYVLFGVWGLIEINKNKSLLFKNKKDFLFHKKYSEKLHHLRDVDRWGKIENDYLFSTIHFEDKNVKSFLLQGDSWIESISEYKKSETLFRDYGLNKNLNFYNAGITSFAPSLMHLQYKILKRDYNINPNFILIYIDHTDIGDEFCRYKKNKVYSKNGSLLKIKNEKYTRATYDYTKLYMYSDLNFQSKFSQISKFPYKKINYFAQRNFNQMMQIINFGYKKRNDHKCSFKHIRKELVTDNPKSKKNLKNSLISYLEVLKNDQLLEKIYLVSFPHRYHFDKSYAVSVSDLIDDVLVEYKDKRFIHFNMSKLDFEKYDLSEIYEKGDLASHLTEEYHSEIFVKKILSFINEKK